MNKKTDIFSRNAQLVVNQLVGEKKKLAKLFNVTSQTIGNWVNGSPSIEFLRWLEEQTGHTLYTLYEVELNMKTIIVEQSNISFKIKENDKPLYETRIDKLITVIEQLTNQINELPALRKRIEFLEKELEKLKKS